MLGVGRTKRVIEEYQVMISNVKWGISHVCSLPRTNENHIQGISSLVCGRAAIEEEGIQKMQKAG